MLPGLVQRCQLAHYLSGMRDASELPAWLLAGRDLREMMGISFNQYNCRDQNVYNALQLVPSPTDSEGKSSQGDVFLPTTNRGWTITME